MQCPHCGSMILENEFEVQEPQCDVCGWPKIISSRDKFPFFAITSLTCSLLGLGLAVWLIMALAFREPHRSLSGGEFFFAFYGIIGTLILWGVSIVAGIFGFFEQGRNQALACLGIFITLTTVVGLMNWIASLFGP